MSFANITDLWQNCKKVLNCLNIILVKLSYKKVTCRNYGVKLCGRVMYKGHVKRSDAGGMQVAQSDLHLWMGKSFNSADFFRVKYICQMVVKQEANKCY